MWPFKKKVRPLKRDLVLCRWKYTSGKWEVEEVERLPGVLQRTIPASIVCRYQDKIYFTWNNNMNFDECKLMELIDFDDFIS